MHEERTVVTLLKGYINEAKIETFIPFKKYRVGALVTKNGYDLYKCLKSATEASISNSRNWIKLRQTPDPNKSFVIKKKTT